MTLMLEAKSISFSYGKLPVLRDVSFEVFENEIVCFVGSNGSGKSTLMKIILGIQRSNSGSIQFLGERIDDLAPHNIVARGLSLVPEGRELFPSLSVLENLELGCTARSGGRRRANALEQAFEVFPVLRERQKQLAGCLSGGEQQMLAIGRAIVSFPKLLLMDEPSLGLSPVLVQQILGLIATLKARGIAILLVEQNVRASLKIADRAYVLERGTVVLEGPAEEISRNDKVRESYLGM